MSRRHVAAALIASGLLENFCKNLCLRNRILPQQHVQKNQTRQTEFLRLVFGDKILLQKHKFSRKFSSKRGDVSPQRVAATSRPACTHAVICRGDLLLQLAYPSVFGAFNLNW